MPEGRRQQQDRTAKAKDAFIKGMGLGVPRIIRG